MQIEAPNTREQYKNSYMMLNHTLNPSVFNFWKEVTLAEMISLGCKSGILSAGGGEGKPVAFTSPQLGFWLLWCYPSSLCCCYGALSKESHDNTEWGREGGEVEVESFLLPYPLTTTSVPICVWLQPSFRKEPHKPTWVSDNLQSSQGSSVFCYFLRSVFSSVSTVLRLLLRERSRRFSTLVPPSPLAERRSLFPEWSLFWEPQMLDNS